MVDVTYFSTIKPIMVRECVEELYNWLVKEVLMVSVIVSYRVIGAEEDAEEEAEEEEEEEQACF